MTETRGVTPVEILAFWRDAGRDRWYAPDDAFDAQVRRRYLDLWRKAAAGELLSWEASDDGMLALVIVLDQFPRNMFRGNGLTYSSDHLAREVARRAISRGAAPSSTPISSDGSDASLTATASWDARPHPTSRPSWTMAAFPADDITVNATEPLLFPPR
jgi:Bacterial protein of unknown function (DUF924)